MDRYQIIEEPLSTDRARSWIADSGAGAVVVFLGVVRNQFEGRASVGLVYEAYREMAEQEMMRIGQDLKHRFGVLCVVMQHRVGRLGLGEASVLVAISAPHRKEAFAACEYGIDRLKAEVPIWKQEIWRDGGASWHHDPDPSNG